MSRSGPGTPSDPQTPRHERLSLRALHNPRGNDSRIRMPTGRQYAVTWSIPDDFGGMTAALLARSSSFARVGGVGVEILTFDNRTDTVAVEERLRSDDTIPANVGIVNLYDWLRQHPLPGGTLRLDRDLFEPISDGAVSRVDASGNIVQRIHYDPAGSVRQIDHLRPDGTLVLSDSRKCRDGHGLTGRSLVLCDNEGTPVRSWRRIWPLYTAWLDALTAGRRSFMIVDSKAIAPFMLQYRNAHTVTAHVIHASHRSTPGDGHPIRASRRQVFEQLDKFDLVAVLTPRQASEVAEDTGQRELIATIPNPFPAHNRPPRSPRPNPGAGIMLASLTQRKRVAHAVNAITIANKPGRTAPVALDIYGEGPERVTLEKLIRDTPHVTLHGHDPHARRHLETASFLVLTSRSEGLPLVLVEAMAAGCIPIAYDIRYGPADLIRHGRNGFLVPDGDVVALAEAMTKLQRLSPRRVAAMRRAASRRARAFGEERIVATWARELSIAQTRHSLRHSRRLSRLRSVLAASRVGPTLRRCVLRVLRVAKR